MTADAVVGAHVTFWGAQWWKENDLSTDATRPSFKGWATNVDRTTCTFTTRTGDSPPPPDGPLSGVDITVLVTSNVTQSGWTISGTITGFAPIATDPGYADNPGHDGTGVVLGFTPCGASGSGGDL